MNRDPGKWESSRDVLQSLGFVPERLSATDGMVIDVSNDTAISSYGKMFTERPTIGIFKSHRRAWQRVVESGETHVLIAEDDIFITTPVEFTRQYIDKALAETPPSFDVLYLGHFGRVGSPTEVSTLLTTVLVYNPLIPSLPYRRISKRVVAPSTPLGLHAYIVSRECCIKLLQHTRVITTHVDMTLVRVFSKWGYRVFALQRRLIHQSSILSTGGATSNGHGSVFVKAIETFSSKLRLPYEPCVQASISFSVMTINGWKLLSILTGVIAVAGVLAGAVVPEWGSIYTGRIFLMINCMDFMQESGLSTASIVACNTVVSIAGVYVGMRLRRVVCSGRRNF